MTQWTITKDHLAEPDAPAGTNRNAVGVDGPSAATLTAEQITGHPRAVSFRMRDDDGELYYEGAMVGDDLFAPLDQFGMPNAGCASIEVLTGRTWERV